MQGAGGLIPSTEEAGCGSIPVTPGKTGGLLVQGHLQLQGEFEIILGYLSPWKAGRLHVHIKHTPGSCTGGRLDLAAGLAT